MHTGRPVVQAIDPLRQGFAGVHPLPAAQLVQVPVGSHTWPDPQLVPGVLFPPSMQRSAPVEQSVTPFLQTPVLVPQLLPELHAMQPPAPLQT